MSRGGRGGGRGGRGGMRGNPLPFEVDLDLVDGAQGSVTDATDENKIKQLYPPMEIIPPAPLTDEDRRLVAIERELNSRFRKSIFWTGSKEQIEAYDNAKGKRKNVHDTFDGMETYSKRKRAKPDSWVPPEKIKWPKMHPDHYPRELWSYLGITDEKKKGEGKKSVKDRLAALDESKEDEGEDADDESVDGVAKAGDDDDAASEPQDSDFEEDEADDADNDYNAENYFSGGEGDDGSVGGEEADEGDDADYDADDEGLTTPKPPRVPFHKIHIARTDAALMEEVARDRSPPYCAIVEDVMEEDK